MDQTGLQPFGQAARAGSSDRARWARRQNQLVATAKATGAASHFTSCASSVPSSLGASAPAAACWITGRACRTATALTDGGVKLPALSRFEPNSLCTAGGGTAVRAACPVSPTSAVGGRTTAGGRGGGVSLPAGAAGREG